MKRPMPTPPCTDAGSSCWARCPLPEPACDWPKESRLSGSYATRVPHGYSVAGPRRSRAGTLGREPKVIDEIHDSRPDSDARRHLRLLQVIAVMSRGGAERLVLDLSTDAVSHGDSVAVAAMPGSWAHRPAEVGALFFPICLVGRKPSSMLRAVLGIRRSLAAFRPDIVHAHNVGATVACRAAIAAMRNPPDLITTLHGVPPESYRVTSRLLGLTTQNVVACSGAVGHRLAAAGYPSDRIEVIQNSVRLEAADPEQIAAFRGAHGFDSRPLVVGVGRLVAQKQWETLIEAVEGMTGVQVVIAGEGPLRADLEKSTKAKGGTVRFVGPVDDIPALLGSADCFVSTSRWEGLPLTLLEALTLGVPSVSTAVDGVLDVITDETAVLVRPGDTQAVREGIERILGDPDMAARLSTAGRDVALDWTLDRMLARYRVAYQRILGGGI